MQPINIKEKFSKFNKQWHPHQIATVDDMQVILAKITGEFVWHSHKEEDELFYVQKGTLLMRFRNVDTPQEEWSETIRQGEIIVVPKGVEHCPVAEEETHFMMIEPASTAHTGAVVSEQTVSVDNQTHI